MFLGFCSYIVALTTTVTHEMLLLGHGFTLPPLGAEVTLEFFYKISPLVLVVFHFFLLALGRNGIETYTLPVLWASVIRWVIYAILPLVVLLFVQGQFLAYHSVSTTFWQQMLVMIDLGLILIFCKNIEEERRKIGVLSWIILLVVVFAVLCFSWGVAAVPEPNDPGRLASCWPFRWPERNLILRKVELIAREPPPELLAFYAQEEGLTIDEARRRHSKGISLNRRNLTGADFTGARLVNADFRGADLRGAHFSGADLRGARFMPAGAADGRFDLPPGNWKRFLIANARGNKELPPTRLEGADFTDALLQDANLILVNAVGATMVRADLSGVELTYADLRRARLQQVRLAGADLWHAVLQGADLTNAHLQAADLSFAELEGAVLEHSHLAAADLSNARLAAAWFVGADLRAARLQDAQSTGASFRGASLQASRGLIPRGISLRQAKLDAYCPDPNLPPQLVDLREVEFPGPEYGGKVWSDSLLDEVPEGPQREAALSRLRTQRIQPYCKARVPPPNLQHLGLLYHDERPPGPSKDWPPVAEQAIQAGFGWTEDDYYAELAALWAEDACRSESTARAMIRLATRPPALAEKELLTALRDRLTQRLEQARVTGMGLPCPALLSLDEKDLRKLAPGKN
jgi:uncharacterized protein YjbI with pentapeptide repeats